MSFGERYLRRLGYIVVKYEKENVFELYGLGSSYHTDKGYQGFCNIYNTVTSLRWMIFGSESNGCIYHCENKEQYDAVNNLVSTFVNELNNQYEIDDRNQS